MQGLGCVPFAKLYAATALDLHFAMALLLQDANGLAARS